MQPEDLKEALMGWDQFKPSSQRAKGAVLYMNRLTRVTIRPRTSTIVERFSRNSFFILPIFIWYKCHA
jgi:hypothetical protein